MKRRYYVVFRGKTPGVYQSWNECRAQVEGSAGASFASFKTRQEAGRAFTLGDLAKWKKVEAAEKDEKWRKAVGRCMVVDAACSGCPGPVEYRGLLLPEKAVAFQCGPYENGTNNIGEFLAIVTGMRWLEKRSLNIPIYSDSKVAIGWVKGGRKCNTTMTDVGIILASEIRDAEKWLRESSSADIYIHMLKKWDTEEYGEIPADFGRK